MVKGFSVCAVRFVKSLIGRTGKRVKDGSGNSDWNDTRKWNILLQR